jgi:hypothetical protein
MQGRLAEFLPGLLSLLLGEMLLEGNCLIMMKCLKISVFRIAFKSTESLRSRIDCWLAMTFGFLKKKEKYLRLIRSLPALCFLWFNAPYLKSLFTVGLVLSTNTVHSFA